MPGKEVRVEGLPPRDARPRARRIVAEERGQPLPCGAGREQRWVEALAALRPPSRKQAARFARERHPEPAAHHPALQQIEHAAGLERADALEAVAEVAEASRLTVLIEACDDLPRIES